VVVSGRSSHQTFDELLSDDYRAVNEADAEEPPGAPEGARHEGEGVSQTIGSGRYYEDFEVGAIYEHPLGRTITAADNAWFTLLTMNTNQMHFNDHYAAQSTFGRQLVNSGLTVAMVLGISVSDVSQNAMANLAWKQIELTHPVFVGDTLYARSLVLAKRESGSRPYAGIVTVRTQGMNQDGDVIMTFERSVMVYRRDAPHDKGFFPHAKVPIVSDDDQAHPAEALR
jgi:itaconyl-CoA hydratase